MIRNRGLLEEFERELAKKEQLNFRKNLRIVDALYKEAVALGVFPLKNPLEGIEVDIKIAKSVNHVQRRSRTRRKTAQ